MFTCKPPLELLFANNNNNTFTPMDVVVCHHCRPQKHTILFELRFRVRFIFVLNAVRMDRIDRSCAVFSAGQGKGKKEMRRKWEQKRK